MPQKHYTPPLSRFIVSVLYHEARVRGIPMTQLANELVQDALKDSPGWKHAEEQARLAEDSTKYSNT